MRSTLLRSSIRNRLALGFFGVSLAAVAFVFFYVTPTLESRLRDEKMNALKTEARRHRGQLVLTLGNLSERSVNHLVSDVGSATNTRVTLLGVSRGTFGVQTYPIADSAGQNGVTDLQFGVAALAAQTRRIETGTENSQGGQVAEAAQPLTKGGKTRIAVFSTPLNDVADTVALIRKQVLVAGALAVVLAVLAGLVIARALSQRIKRIQRAAGRVAKGDFSARFPVDRKDELGELALALDDMQRQLAQLDSARKRFIATASHELRTPIFSLGGFVELLQDEDLDENERQEFLTQVREQVARLGRLTTELLDLSRLEAGSLELRPEQTEVGVLAEAVTGEFVPALTRHRSHLELRRPRRGIEAVCDPDRVAQILRILIDNAVTHTPEGTDIVVSASRRNGNVQLAVRDTGPGIDGAAQARIFEPFYTSDDAQGSGLGLAIAHELAERMSGRLSVDSRPGRTTFTFELPA